MRQKRFTLKSLLKILKYHSRIIEMLKTVESLGFVAHITFAQMMLIKREYYNRSIFVCLAEVDKKSDLANLTSNSIVL